MASKVKASTVLFLSLHLLFFALASPHSVDNPSDNVSLNGAEGIRDDSLNGNSHDHSKNSSSTTNIKNPVIIRPGDKFPYGDDTQNQSSTCNPLNFSVCLKLLHGLVNVERGDVPTKPCCSLIEGLLDLEAAVCLCTTVRANVLGIKLDLPISLNLLLNNCGRRVRTEYICSL